MGQEVAEAKEINNSLSDMTNALTSNFMGAQVSQTDTMWINVRGYLISNDRTLLSQSCAEHGIIQTLIDQPVDDGFRAGVEIKTSQLDDNDIELIFNYMETNNVLHEIGQTGKWARLFGGGGLMAITDQDREKPLNVKAIKADTPLEFRACDMWELYNTSQNAVAGTTPGSGLGDMTGDFFQYYGLPVHRSRVCIMKGKEAPSFLKPRLRGWGMSEVERLVRSFNQYLKNQDVLFELLDEAKVDVYRMKGFNSALLTSGGTQEVTKRIQNANAIKNFQSAITMDISDEYEQKQVNFTGLAEVLTQIRQGIACDVKMPITKLFGISSAGFNSGEDDLENYNSMVDSEVRAKMRHLIIFTVMIICQKLFGFMPSDLRIKFPPLRVMTAEQEETVKDKQFTRTTTAFTLGLATAQEAKAGINRNSLLPAEVDETTDAEPPSQDDGSDDDGEDKGKKGDQ
jgi:phage-related protein (TIGR01555 family)